MATLFPLLKDWLRARKRAMCVSVRSGGGQGMKEGISKEEGELSREIATLSDLTIEELKERWRSNYDSAPPGRCSKKLLVSAIAYRTQERASGGLKPSVLRQLEHAADDACAHRVLQPRPVTKAHRK